MSANRTKTGKRAAPSTAFKPGQSGNPNGRPKIPPELREAAKSAAPEALQVAIDLMRNPAVEPADRLRAVSIVLDRAYGKPVQATEISGPDGGPIMHEAATVGAMSDEELRRYVEQARARARSAGLDGDLPSPS